MIKTTIAVLGAAAFTLASGGAFAQSALSGSDDQTLQSCKAMQPDVMEKDPGCVALMQSHPGIMSGRSSASTPGGPNSPIQPNGTGTSFGTNSTAAPGSGAGAGRGR
jgi:hypothetical protein